MLNTLKKRIKNEKGLSLVELLAVIVILGIIAAIAIPSIGNIIENSKTKAEISDAIQVLNAANIYFTDNPTEPLFTKDNSDEYLDSNGTLTSYTVSKGTPNTIVFVGARVETEAAKNLTDLNAVKVKGGDVQGTGWKNK